MFNSACTFITKSDLMTCTEGVFFFFFKILVELYDFLVFELATSKNLFFFVSESVLLHSFPAS